jgi:hypothetical protein
MSYDPQIVVVRDQDGVEHHASRWSDWVVSGLADGSLTEVDDAATPDASGDHGVDTGPGDNGSGDGEPAAGGTGGDGDAGVPESAAGR